MNLETREQVMNAILARIQAMTFDSAINGQTSWVTTSRRLKLWSDVDPSAQPAAFLVEHEEHDEYRQLGLLRRRLNPRVWCYAPTGNPADNSPIIGGTLLNIMLEAFDSEFAMGAANDFGKQAITLNGLVYFTRLEGRVFKDPGDIDNQALLIVPLVVEMP